MTLAATCMLVCAFVFVFGGYIASR